MHVEGVRVVEGTKFLSKKLDEKMREMQNLKLKMQNGGRSAPLATANFHFAFLILHSLYSGAMKVQIKRLDHVQLCIPFGEEERAREFYGVLLGLEEIEKPDALKPNGGLWFKVADIQLHIGVEEAQGKSKRHPAFEVEDLEGIREYLVGNGVKIKEETPVPGLKRFSFFDPFGNRIELLEKP